MHKRILKYTKNLIFLLIMFIFIFTNQTLSVDASGGIPVHLSMVQFDTHRGMVAVINGQYVYCIQRGKPFRSASSDLQMTVGEVNVDPDNITGSELIYNGTLVTLLEHMNTFEAGQANTIVHWFRG